MHDYTPPVLEKKKTSAQGPNLLYNAAMVTETFHIPWNSTSTVVKSRSDYSFNSHFT